MIRCEEYQAEMVAFVRGELRALEQARMETHLSRCAECARVERELRLGIGAAATFAPAAEPEHMDRLLRRLAPYVEQARPRVVAQRLAFAGAVFAASVAVIVVVLAGPWRAPVQQVAPAVAVREVDVAPREAPAVVRKAVTPHLRVVASRDWDGRVSRRDEETTALAMERGFAVMSFEGGSGRIIQVETPSVTLEGVGSKFFVSVVRDGLTTIGVVSGRVRVTTPAGVEELEAGRTRSWDRGGAPSPEVPAAAIPEVDFQDAFLEVRAGELPPVDGALAEASRGDASRALEPPGGALAEASRGDASRALEPPGGALAEETAIAASRVESTKGANAAGAASRGAAPEGAARAGASAGASSRGAAPEGAARAGTSAGAPALGAPHAALEETARTGGAAPEGAARAGASADTPALATPQAVSEDGDGTAGVSSSALDEARGDQAPGDAPRAEETPPIVAPPPPDVLGVLADAERLAASGRAAAALRALEDLLADPAVTVHRGLVRYEAARLLGFQLQQPARARAELRVLATQERGEVGTQAAFALCELDLATNPCATAACLHNVAVRAQDEDVRREAIDLTRRWRVDQIDCTRK